MTAPLHLSIEGAVAHLLIDRADKRNAFNHAMWAALPALVTQAMADPAVRVLMVRSASGGAFCAGADIAEFATGAQDPDWRMANQAAINAAMVTLAQAAKPVIAVIEGACVGGGCGLSLACDFRIATPDARMGITPSKLGLVYPLHDTKLLVDLVGPSAAKRILFTGQLMDAAEALRIGLVDIVVEDALADARRLADAIAAASPHTVREAKRMIRRILNGQAQDDAETLALFAEAFDGPDFAEGAAAFLEKRPPRF